VTPSLFLCHAREAQDRPKGENERCAVQKDGSERVNDRVHVVNVAHPWGSVK
jgi:hypothetical protein